ncbi:YdeI/OmpD-associated family protein [Algoriphagus litoralis]|uniref:YdeI/OmpD-associated family protein n=1 Tax=Algoriphagus litoralis TaxID=2202829 RepID=UPI000DBAD933|nr:YdeI/OmpD-associated family protein [Algoriphagus litoralis]
MNPTNPQVDRFLLEGCMRCSKGATPDCKVHRWTAILEKLRQHLLRSNLAEDRKWGVPVYTLSGKNVILLGVFNDSCVMSFIKGSLMKDPEGILELPGPNSHEGRIIRFTKIEDLEKVEALLPQYIQEAIEIEKSGKKSEVPIRGGMEIPEELTQKFEEHEGLEKAFFTLTPGRQRGYLIHFTGAKQAATRLSRIEKCVAKIMVGKGIMD